MKIDGNTSREKSCLLAVRGCVVVLLLAKEKKRCAENSARQAIYYGALLSGQKQPQDFSNYNMISSKRTLVRTGSPDPDTQSRIFLVI